MEPVLCCCRGTTAQTVLCDATLLFFSEVQMTNKEGEPKKKEEVEEVNHQSIICNDQLISPQASVLSLSLKGRVW